MIYDKLARNKFCFYVAYDSIVGFVIGPSKDAGCVLMLETDFKQLPEEAALGRFGEMRDMIDEEYRLLPAGEFKNEYPCAYKHFVKWVENARAGNVAFDVAYKLKEAQNFLTLVN